VTLDREKEESLEPSYTSAYGLQTRFYEAGDPSARTVVLVHGGEPGQQAAADTWRWNIEALAAQLHVLAPDRAGAGYTENFATEEQLRIGEICNHLAAFLDARAVRDCVLVGQSRGAFVVLELARLRPDLAGALVLTNGASVAPRYSAWKHRDDFGTLLGGAENIRHDLEWLTTVHDRFTDDYVAEIEQMLSSEGQIEARRAHAAVATEYFADFERTKQELLGWLRSGGFDKPVLMAWGADDPMTHLEDAIEIFNLVRKASPFARMTLFNRCGHSPFAEYPDEFNALVASFVASLD
jgi:4,5:9,10-diseco-3-hydroxy-5,9,17-trioxoandrosta-1(10),2-diene-4-oate hydrolase